MYKDVLYFSVFLAVSDAVYLVIIVKLQGATITLAWTKPLQKERMGYKRIL